MTEGVSEEKIDPQWPAYVEESRKDYPDAIEIVVRGQIAGYLGAGVRFSAAETPPLLCLGVTDNPDGGKRALVRIVEPARAEGPAEGLEPRGCPIPGACACPSPQSPDERARIICDFMGWPEDGPAWADAHKLAASLSARAEGPAPPGGGGEEDYRGSLRSAPGSTSHQTDGAGECSKAAADVLAERRRQVEVEGWTPEHDDEHGDGSMALAAACYAFGTRALTDGVHARMIWPAGWEFKPDNRRRELVKAAALIVAEIERLDRAALTTSEGR